MKKTSILFLLCQVICLAAFAQVKVDGLLTENLLNPVGLDVAHPRFTWLIRSDLRNVSQTAYEIKVSCGKTLVWGSGKVNSSQSVHVVYNGSPLESGKSYIWQVKVWDNSGKASAWSPKATFRTAFLKPGDWKARWIEPGYEENPDDRPSPLMRKQFTTAKPVASAIAYISAHGMYEAQINGQRVGDACLTPGWTEYKKRIQYQVYDVTALIKKGNNLLGATLGNGWYRGIIGYTNNINVYGKEVALLFQVDLTYTDGTHESIISDSTWKSSTGAIRYAEIYNGEVIDARLDKTGWGLPGYDDQEWSGVKVRDYPLDNLVATCNEPVKKHETLNPVKIFRTPAGEQVIDFGQNLVGWVRMRASGPAGTKIVLSHAEVLDKEGNFYTKNLREARAQDIYYLKGSGEEVFEPHFTWHGFRYLKVEGYPGEINPANFEAIALYSDMKLTGSFTCSDALINQLQHNIQWGQKGNFLDVPTDCPQRDERLGWTGDAQAFSRTASFNMNVNSFFTKWLKDLEADQVDGKVPYVIPNILGVGAVNSAGWADVATIVPWNMFLAYGDKQILEQQYNSMKAYVESIRKSSRDDLWNSGFHFGDWLFYRPDDDNDGKAAVTDKYLIAQCFYANSVQLLIKAAEVLDRKEDAASYSKLLQDVKAAFLKEYVTPNGRLVSGTQTAYVLALNFDMLPEDLRQQAAKRLVDNIQSYGYHLTTGFLGTPYICHVLSRYGYTDIAYRLLLQKTYPSWLYPVTMGATTIWERWDGIRPDSTFENPGMNSFNHYAYGAIGDWMYRVAAGLDTYDGEGAGYRHSIIRPHIIADLPSVSASLDTYYGRLSNSFAIENGKLSMTVEIPANTTATVYVPAKDIATVYEGGKILTKEFEATGPVDGYVILKAGSGKYQFTSTW
jgi:alpha-L-rhamnosidase